MGKHARVLGSQLMDPVIVVLVALCLLVAVAGVWSSIVIRRRTEAMRTTQSAGHVYGKVTFVDEMKRRSRALMDSGIMGKRP